MALNGLFCADVPLRNYSLTHFAFKFECSVCVVCCVVVRWRTRRIRSGTDWLCMNRRLSGLVLRHRSQRASRSLLICRYWSSPSLSVHWRRV